jgi:hypothetical protein
VVVLRVVPRFVSGTATKNVTKVVAKVVTNSITGSVKKSVQSFCHQLFDVQSNSVITIMVITNNFTHLFLVPKANFIT